MYANLSPFQQALREAQDDLAKAKANHPTALSPMDYVLHCLSSYAGSSDLLVRFRTDPAFRDALYDVRRREQREADLSRYPDDGVATAAPYGSATAAVESQGGAA